MGFFYSSKYMSYIYHFLLQAVQNVLNNLLIAHVELRSEESPDIQQYSHERRVDKIVVPLGQELTRIKEKYIQVSLYAIFCLSYFTIQFSAILYM